MKTFVILLLGFLPLAYGEPSTVNFERIVRYSDVVAGNSIKVVLHKQLYDFSECEVTGGRAGDEEPAKVNGVEFAGTDGASPVSAKGWPQAETLADVVLEWNGIRIPVPKELHINLLALSLEEDSIQFIPRPSGDELLIQATGGDGGGSYIVSLVLRKNGNHKQYECAYHEDGLRLFPYEVEEQIGTDEDGRTIIRTFPWLDNNKKQNKAEMATPRKPSD